MNVCVMIKTVAVVSLGVISPHLIRSSSLLQFTEFNINNCFAQENILRCKFKCKQAISFQLKQIRA